MVLQRSVGKQVVTTANDADDAVGVNGLHWYIAVVTNRSERKCSESLRLAGYESYVAIQRETHIWKNGRKADVDRIVLPSLVFVRTTETDRLKRVAFLPYVKRFVSDPARRKEEHAPAPAAIVPDAEMQTLKFMLERSEHPVIVDAAVFQSGDRVEVVSGRLKGLQGIVRRVEDGKSRLFVSLDILGSAHVEIDRKDLKSIS